VVRETQGVEEGLVERMLGRERASALMTDAYKFSMAQAGFPLRTETFYLSFRSPGWYLVPFDLAQVVRRLCPKAPSAGEKRYLRSHGYDLSPAMEAALGAEPNVWSVPKGSWVREREPILSVTAPSFLASWLEPLVIWLHHPIQVATRESESERARGYRERVRRHAGELVRALSGDAARLFEVGMRSAHSMAMHEAALHEIAAAGVTGTSNVFLARKLGLTPVGTTGHEHQQRWGTDLEGFRAIRDMRPGAPSYLFDTFDTHLLGIPAAVQAMRERPKLAASVRFDSGNHEAQLRELVTAGVEPSFIFMDSMNPERVARLERTAIELGVPRARRLYGAGGYLVGAPSSSALTRDRVAAVYKLSESGGRPVMKFSVPTKTSVPGRPVVFRRSSGHGPVGLIGQRGEAPPAGYRLLAPSDEPNRGGNQYVGLSPRTAAHVRHLDSQITQERKAS